MYIEGLYKGSYTNVGLLLDTGTETLVVIRAVLKIHNHDFIKIQRPGTYMTMVVNKLKKAK
jgi:hypothetical protein